jgi:hypothetical protein
MRRLAAVLLTGLLAILLPVGPAYAHGGPIKLDVHGDGGQGVNATVMYKNDGHPVSEEVVLSYTAVTADGQTLGPVRMRASAEGQSFYVGEQPLPVGAWTVTVSATRPSPAQQTVSITSTVLPAKAAVPPATGGPGATVIILSVVPMLVALAGAVLLRRRKMRAGLKS